MDLSNYETRVFPSSPLLNLSAVDSFADLTDSFRSSSVAETQIAYAQYYNKLADSVEEIQNWFRFTPASISSSGTYGEPIYNPTCPTTSYSLGASGDGSIATLLGPYVFRRNLSNVWQDIHLGLTTNATGNCLPWEIVITKDLTKNYSNHPSVLLKQETSFWDYWIDGREIVTSAFVSLNHSVPQNYEWLGDLSVHHYAIRTDNHFIIRGFVQYKLSNSISNPWREDVLNSAVLNVSILSLSS